MEIVIGGKRKDNGEWVYGAYFYIRHTDGRNHTHHLIIPNGVDMSRGTPIEKIQVEVIPETMGIFSWDRNNEPEEMLMVRRKDAIDFHNKYVGNPTREISRLSLRKEINSLFGDKCLPDTPNTPNSGELKPQEVDCQPKKFFESDYYIGDKVIIAISSIGNPRKEVVTLLRQYQPQCEYNEYAKTWVVQTQAGMTYQSNEEHFEPYTEPESRNLSQEIANCDKPEDNQLKDNMEEKELNLCELLKNCIGEEFWSPMFDVVKLSRIDLDDNKPLFFNFKGGVIYTRANGVMYENTLPIIFPSRALYEKYPLDAKKAWNEWQESRKPKRWRAKRDDEYWLIDSDGEPCTSQERFAYHNNANYNFGNYFRTEEEAQQAAEAVRETLNKFQESLSQSK